MAYTFTVTDAPDEEAIKAMLAPLVQFNESLVGSGGYRPLGVLLRNDGGHVIGGLWGATHYGWLFTQVLVVPEYLRGRGFGTRLMRLAEEEAMARGCHAAWLDTHEFQARGFYERLGYVCFGELSDYPHGFARFFMRKSLATDRGDVSVEQASRMPRSQVERAAALYIFSGLPGSGKSTLAQGLAQHTGAAYLRIDTIEQSLRDICGIEPTSDEGYRLAYRIAADNLQRGVSVVADSCNPIEVTRRAWVAVAKNVGARYINIEIVCSNADEHRRRIERRRQTVPGLRLPTWSDVKDREYHPWDMERSVIDTADKSERACLTELIARLDEAKQ